MNRSLMLPRLSRSLTTGLVGVLCLLALISAGCRSTATDPDSGKTPRPTSQLSPSLPRTPGTTRLPPSRPGSGKTIEEQRFEAAQKKEMEITSQLEQANAMLQGSNLEGALRQVQRVAQENGQDPYVTMRTSYLEAMIYHKMKDGPKRKDAMNRLLKNMETLQGDPRFQQGFIDGMANQEVIKMSLEKAGKQYGN